MIEQRRSLRADGRRMNSRLGEVESVVFVVDDDPSMRRALSNLIRSVGLGVKVFESASDFLTVDLPDVPCCMVLDVRLPGLSGLDFQAKLSSANVEIPIIFVTAHGDIPMTVRAMKAGAVEFLPKPFRDQDLLDAIQVALDRAKKRLEGNKALAILRAKFETLTPREQEIMALVTRGLLNKQIAAEMGITEYTVKMHRGSVTRKMGVRSVAELVRIADHLGLSNVKSQ